MILRQPDDCSPWGIVRPALPLDDAAQDAICALAAEFEHARIDLHLAGTACLSERFDGACTLPAGHDGDHRNRHRTWPNTFPLAGPASPRRTAIPGRVANPRPGELDDALPNPAASIPAAPHSPLRVELNRPPVSAARSGAGVEANRLASPCSTNRTN